MAAIMSLIDTLFHEITLNFWGSAMMIQSLITVREGVTDEGCYHY